MTILFITNTQRTALLVEPDINVFLTGSKGSWRERVRDVDIIVNADLEIGVKMEHIDALRDRPRIGPKDSQFDALLENFGNIAFTEGIPMWRRDHSPYVYTNTVGRTFNGKDWTGEPYLFSGKTSRRVNRVFDKLCAPFGEYLQGIDYQGPFAVEYTNYRLSNFALAPDTDFGYTGYMRKAIKHGLKPVETLLKDCSC